MKRTLAERMAANAQRREQFSVAQDIEYDPSTEQIADLFAGIRFRDGQRAEAVRRVQQYENQRFADVQQHARDIHQRHIDEKNAEIRELMDQITRLERAVRTQNFHHATALIECADSPHAFKVDTVAKEKTRA